MSNDSPREARPGDADVAAAPGDATGVQLVEQGQGVPAGVAGGVAEPADREPVRARRPGGGRPARRRRSPRRRGTTRRRARRRGRDRASSRRLARSIAVGRIGRHAAGGQRRQHRVIGERVARSRGGAPARRRSRRASMVASTARWRSSRAATSRPERSCDVQQRLHAGHGSRPGPSATRPIDRPWPRRRSPVSSSSSSTSTQPALVDHPLAPAGPGRAREAGSTGRTSSTSPPPTVSSRPVSRST